MNTNPFFLFVLLLFGMCIIHSCNQSMETTKKVDTEQKDYSVIGDSISMIAQQELLKNVGAAINNGGTEYAVEFCNVHALRLTDSISAANNIIISRISDKNRNPSNKLNKNEKKLFERFKNGLKDTLIEENGDQVYYKAIHIGMPTCLKCHGSNEDIDPKTKSIISKKYTEDLAIGYKQGDFRGAWKLVFKN